MLKWSKNETLKIEMVDSKIKVKEVLNKMFRRLLVMEAATPWKYGTDYNSRVDTFYCSYIVN